MRIIAIAVTVLLAFASVLQAQVAAPRINPAAGVAGSTFNPAVISWGGPSRIGGALINMDVEDQPAAGGSAPAASGDGMAAQVRLVGDNAGFHAEFTNVSLDVEPAFGGKTIEVDSTFIGGSYQWNDSFSLGAGIQSRDEDFQGTVTESSLPYLGFTLRLGDTLLVGAATGTETVTELTAEVGRSVVMAGAALHSRDKMGGYHLEAFMEDKASGEDTVNGLNVDEESTFGLTAEVIFAENFLIGLERRKTDRTDPTSPTNDLELESTAFIVGWVMDQGLSFVASTFTDKETRVTSGDVIEFSGTALAVAYAF